MPTVWVNRCEECRDEFHPAITYLDHVKECPVRPECTCDEAVVDVLGECQSCFKPRLDDPYVNMLREKRMVK